LESEFADGPIGLRPAVKRSGFIAVMVVLAVILWLCLPVYTKFIKSRSERAPQSEAVATGVAVTTVSTPSVVQSGPAAPLLGETILRDYANTNLPPENDLTLMSRLMENSLLLLKSAANRSLSANEDWAGLLRGQNAAHESFLPAQHIALNSQGQLVDRWGTPLFFHVLGGGRVELRSAGPDKKLWSADDLHRNADGSFRRGVALNAPSLLEAATRERSPSTAP
jgi:hypothetical protein